MRHVYAIRTSDRAEGLVLSLAVRAVDIYVVEEGPSRVTRKSGSAPGIGFSDYCVRRALQ